MVVVLLVLLMNLEFSSLRQYLGIILKRRLCCSGGMMAMVFSLLGILGCTKARILVLLLLRLERRSYGQPIMMGLRLAREVMER
ncbi:hypothetical protein LMG919_20650 [Xanthomonas vesicatoria]|uniref:Uncharacterized protein n=1 Tax=Xanthomonas vesicatoria ATCC 35937 TaxID=925775 RepID=F0BK05_9XANT|nr:hypothetical protein XVE_4618 [Xanthomonas vesicatoria ATCC 35937]KTF30749.1 hypothetical protein LMG919_20650 [Xanthomonas vesicatoria]KTF31540.1 hypothetical protein LMG920_15890 [Xanthomonas vesicatoria]